MFQKKKGEEKKRKTDAERATRYRLNKELKTEISEPNIFSKENQKKKAKAERDKEYRLKRTLQMEQKRARESEIMEPKYEPVCKKFISEQTIADIEFNKHFYENPFELICSVCDCLWFERDICCIPRKRITLFTNEFPDEDANKFKICQTCYKSLIENKISRLFRSNGFLYRPYPTHFSMLSVND